MVLYDVTETYVKVADPALGLRKIPRKEFEQSWSGYAALFDYTVAFASAPESKPGLAWILPFLAKFRTIFLQVLLLAVAVTFLELLFPIFTEMVVDKVIVEKDIGLLKTILLGMGAALFFVQARRSRRNICSPSPPCGSTPRSSISSAGRCCRCR